MTNSNLTQVLLVVDRSGSMSGVANDMRGAIDEFFSQQAALDGECVVDYVQFDDTYEVVYTDRPVAEAKSELNPRGMTALLDAVGKSVTDLGVKLKNQNESERPGTVIVVVVTDGYENSSKDWTREGVAQLIKQQEETYKWEFTFLGANMDAVAVGQSFGFQADNSLTYATANAGETFASLSSYVTRSRKGSNEGYTQDERDAAIGNI